ncbi:MAG: cytochrome c biogenesis protein CcsA [Deltaproteobacteria bacterium]|jgi:ABC-type uncharacterized transport system permease subunit|nr:cytochrome c biogenesis protein CcsA [Deltaproteobacteria bacterium]MBW2532874.1 cytochrome c biogenesis protein CcsA [Deltaproteobacteria bacterium]
MPSAIGIATFLAAALLYGAAAVLYYLDVARGTAETLRPNRAPSALLGAGAVAHLAYVLVASLLAHACPVYSIHFFLSMASVFAIGVYLVARRSFRIHGLGLLLAPVGLMVTLSTFALGRPGAPGTLPPRFIGLHVFANLCGSALFLLACVAAVLYLAKERRLKKKRGVLKAKLPSLDSLDRAAHRFVLAGFPLLTVGLATGTMSAPRLDAVTADGLLRALFGWATWLLFGVVLLLRRFGWRGRRAAYGTVAGFACALIVLLIYVLRPALHGAALLGG